MEKDEISATFISQKRHIPTLTIYLSCLEKRIPYPTHYVMQLHTLVHSHLDVKAKNAWRNEISKIEQYLHQELHKDARSIVFFVTKTDFTVMKFQFYLSPACMHGRNAYIKPLLDTLGKYPRFLIILYDRRHARFLTINQNVVENYHVFDDGKVPQKVKATKVNAAREGKINHAIDNCLYKRLRLIAKEVDRYATQKNIKKVYFGSHQDLLDKMKHVLPHTLQNKIALWFVIDVSERIENIVIKNERAIANQMSDKL